MRNPKDGCSENRGIGGDCIAPRLIVTGANLGYMAHQGTLATMRNKSIVR